MKNTVFYLLCLLLMLIPFAAQAEASEPAPIQSGNYSYILLEDGTAEIVDYSGDEEILEIPSELDGYAVTSVGNEAFSDCRSLTTVSIPDSVTAIGDEAFSFCFHITSVSIPDSVSSVGANPFAGCNTLSDISVSPDHPALEVIDSVLFSKADKRLICYPCSFTAAEYAIPNGTLGIGDGAFNWCDSLTSVSIPDSVTSIGNGTFLSCDNLTSVSIPNSVASIGDYAFSSCESLTSVSLPDSIASVGTNPFYGCSTLTDISVSPDHPALEVIDGVLFSKADKRLIFYPHTSSSAEYAVPDGILSIGDSAFAHLYRLTSVSIPDSVTSIGDYAFSACSGLTSVSIPDSVTFIGKSAFLGCENLTSVSIPDSVTSIGDGAFDQCENLTLTVEHDSFAAQYAKDNELNYVYPDALDWLTE